MHSVTQERTYDWPDAFDHETFREYSDIILRKLSSYLNDRSVRGLKIVDPHELSASARRLMTDERELVCMPDRLRFERLIDLCIQTGIQVHSPGYMGRQFSGIIPLAGAIDMVGSIVNQPASFYEAGQLPNVAERIMAAEFNRFIGWPAGSFDMVSTSGGALGNLTAILAARNTRYPDIWTRGYNGLNRKPAVALSEEGHYSIFRAISILGIGEDQIVKLPLDEQRRIIPGAIDALLDQARANGLDVFCLVASAGTTSIGAIDPLDEIADIAHRRDLWMHVDGAHGASIMVSDRLRDRLKGLAKCDSFVLDAHKMLFVPAACSLLFYRNREHAEKAFRQKASYVFDKDADTPTAAFDSAGKNFECTKRPTILNLWAMWALYGPALFAQKMECLIDLTQGFYEYLVRQPDFETIHRPEINILCFRYLPKPMPGPTLARLQKGIWRAINLEKKFFVSKVDIDDCTALRVVFMNHLITEDHYAALIGEMRRIGRELSEEIASDQCS